VPFKYRPTPKPLARSRGVDELAKGGERKFTWTEIRKPLIASIKEKTLEGTYESLVEAAWDAEDGLDAWSGLQLIRWWWWSKRSSKTAGAAAEWLRSWIRHELEMGREYYAESAYTGHAGARRTEYERRAALLSERASDKSFAAGIVVEMASYDPRENRHSPYYVLSKILDKKLTAILGGPPGPRQPKPTDLGRELMRLFRLEPDDPARKRLEWCLSKLTTDERDYIWLRYRDDIKHEAVLKQKQWSDRTVNDIRRSAVTKLQVCMPALIVFATPSRKN
jgi:hypothetical protein